MLTRITRPDTMATSCVPFKAAAKASDSADTATFKVTGLVAFASKLFAVGCSILSDYTVESVGFWNIGSFR